MIDRYNRNAQEMVPAGRTHEGWLAEQERQKEEARKANEEARVAYLKRIEDRDAAKR